MKVKGNRDDEGTIRKIGLQTVSILRHLSFVLAIHTDKLSEK
jgi:hypothetical protein